MASRQPALSAIGIMAPSRLMTTVVMGRSSAGIAYSQSSSLAAAMVPTHSATF